MHGHWHVPDAIRRFSELIRAVEAEGPQFITRHGEEVAVVLSVADYGHLRGEAGFKTFLRSVSDLGLEIYRSVSP